MTKNKPLRSANQQKKNKNKNLKTSDHKNRTDSEQGSTDEETSDDVLDTELKNEQILEQSFLRDSHLSNEVLDDSQLQPNHNKLQVCGNSSNVKDVSCSDDMSSSVYSSSTESTIHPGQDINQPEDKSEKDKSKDVLTSKGYVNDRLSYFRYEHYKIRYNKNDITAKKTVQNLTEESKDSLKKSSFTSSSFVDGLSRSFGKNDVRIKMEGQNKKMRSDTLEKCGSVKERNSKFSVFERMRKYSESFNYWSLIRPKEWMKREEMKPPIKKVQVGNLLSEYEAIDKPLPSQQNPIEESPNFDDTLGKKSEIRRQRKQPEYKLELTDSDINISETVESSSIMSFDTDSKFNGSENSCQMGLEAGDSNRYEGTEKSLLIRLQAADSLKGSDKKGLPNSQLKKLQKKNSATRTIEDEKGSHGENGITVNGIETAENGHASISKRSQDDDDDECGSGWGYWLEYLMVLLVAFVLLLGCVFLVLFWCFYYRKGYNSWKVDRYQQFNLHPTLMVGAVTFTGFSVLMYRIGRCSRRLYVKLLHATFHLLAILCFVGGFLSIFEWHNMISLPHFYSLHSWIGFITMGLFGVQFLVGFVSFLVLLCCESATAGFRACLLPLHTTFGLTIFLISIATCLTGLVQRTNSTIGEDYVSLPEEAIVINALGVALVAVGVAVTYALGRTSLRVKSDCYISERL